MTNRPSGFYWIKMLPESAWTVGQFSAESDCWLLPGIEGEFNGSEFYKIGHEVKAPYDKQ